VPRHPHPSHRRELSSRSSAVGGRRAAVVAVAAVSVVGLTGPLLAAAVPRAFEDAPGHHQRHLVAVTLQTPTAVTSHGEAKARVSLQWNRALPAGLVVLRIDGRRAATSEVAGGGRRTVVELTIPRLAPGAHEVSAGFRAFERLMGKSASTTVVADETASPTAPPSVTASPSASSSPRPTSSPTRPPTTAPPTTQPPTTTPPTTAPPTGVPPTTVPPTTTPPTTAPPSSPPATRTGCAPQPSACGYPDATNTGISGSPQLQTVNGSLTVTQDGAVVENKIITGNLNIDADNVTVRNVRILEDGESWGIGLLHTRNTTIENCEITPSSSRLVVGIKDVYGDAHGTTVRRCEIVRTTTGIQTHEGLIEDNYIHDMAYQDGDHLNGTTSNGSTEPLTIRHNTIFNQEGQTDAISLFQDFGLEANRTITDNLLAGGGYTIYGGEGTHGTTYNIVITNNRIARTFYPQGGYWGPVADFELRGSGNVFRGNTWDDTGSTIPAPGS
jgi:hypothetical protein